jgi:peptidoglycan glycosyltransferase
MQAMLVVAVFMFVLLGGYLLYTTVAHGDEWFSSPYNPRISAANNIKNAGGIYDRNGVRLAWSEGDERKYAQNTDMRRAVSHIVGDVYGMSVGAESYFAKYLYGYDQGIMDKFLGAAAGSETRGGDVYLTIDANLSEYIYNNMDYNGAAVLMNYQTGEILASVSVPTFDPENIKSDTDDAGSKYVNRAVQGRYPPGSTMKLVTTACAVENGVTTHETDCTGTKTIAGQKITCPTSGGHGHVNFDSAFTRSCNIYYAELANLLGESSMKSTAERMGFNQSFDFTDINVSKSSYEAPNNDGDLGWAGIGQYKDLVTPMHNMLISAGVANGGTVMEPKTLLDVRYGSRSGYTFRSNTYRSIMSSGTAQQVGVLMRQTVDHGTATSANIGGATVCGKTGTAEYYDNEAGAVKNHSWFVGYVEDSSHPLAIAVILEGAGFGSAHATPLAGQIFSKAIELGY